MDTALGISVAHSSQTCWPAWIEPGRAANSKIRAGGVTFALAGCGAGGACPPTEETSIPAAAMS
jgi:hypothetical protein